MYSVHIRIPSAAARRSGGKAPLKVVRQQKKRPAFLEPLNTKPVLPLLPASPCDSLDGEETPTLRPVIIVEGLDGHKRPQHPRPRDVPGVDSAIESPGFRPCDDSVVRRKEEERSWKYCLEADGYDCDPYEDDYCYHGSAWRSPAFTDHDGERMSRLIGAHVDNVIASHGPMKLQKIEWMLNFLLALDRLDDFLDWTPLFAKVLKAKLAEFVADPLATAGIQDKAEQLLEAHFQQGDF